MPRADDSCSTRLLSKNTSPLNRLTRASLITFELVKPTSRPLIYSPAGSSSSTGSSPALVQELWAELAERRTSSSSTASSLSARSQCTEVMHECLRTLESLAKEDDESQTATVDAPTYRRPSRISADEVRRWSQMELPQQKV